MYSIMIKRVTQEQQTERNYRQIGKDEDGEAKHGYVDEVKTRDVERVIYTQIVDELDLIRVISAVNWEEK